MEQDRKSRSTLANRETLKFPSKGGLSQITARVTFITVAFYAWRNTKSLFFLSLLSSFPSLGSLASAHCEWTSVVLSYIFYGDASKTSIFSLQTHTGFTTLVWDWFCVHTTGCPSKFGINFKPQRNLLKSPNPTPFKSFLNFGILLSNL